MIRINDFKEKKLVFVIEDEEPIKLKIQNNNLCLSRDHKCFDKMPLILISSLFIVGNFTITSQVFRQFAKYGISIFFLSRSLQTYNQVVVNAKGNYELQRRQFVMLPIEELQISKKIVINKVENQFKTLKKSKKDIGELDLENTIEQINRAGNLATLRGIEGLFAKQYFNILFQDIGWLRRAPRTKEDIPNLLLDVGYTMLFNYIDALLEMFGFNVYKGIYHRLFFQRKSLVSDVMEPLRPLIDYQLLKSYNLKQVNEKDFKYRQGKYIFKDFKISSKYSQIWLTLLMKHNEEIYKYIYGFYRYIFKPSKYKFISFSI